MRSGKTTRLFIYFVYLFLILGYVISSLFGITVSHQTTEAIMMASTYFTLIAIPLYLSTFVPEREPKKLSLKETCLVFFCFLIHLYAFGPFLLGIFRIRVPEWWSISSLPVMVLCITYFLLAVFVFARYNRQPPGRLLGFLYSELVWGWSDNPEKPGERPFLKAVVIWLLWALLVYWSLCFYRWLFGRIYFRIYPEMQELPLSFAIAGYSYLAFWTVILIVSLIREMSQQRRQ